MKIYPILQMFVLSYTVLVILITLIIIFLQTKYHNYQLEKNREIGIILNKLRGKMTVLLPLRILSIIFILCWLTLALPWIDLLVHTHLITSFDATRNAFFTWIGTFYGEQQSYYFWSVLICGVVGCKGFFLIGPLARTLSDTSLVIGPEGLRYKKEVF